MLFLALVHDRDAVAQDKKSDCVLCETHIFRTAREARVVVVFEKGAEEGGVCAAVVGVFLARGEIDNEVRHVCLLVEDAVDGVVERVVEHRVHVALVGVRVVCLAFGDLAHAENAGGGAEGREEVAVYVLDAVDTQAVDAVVGDKALDPAVHFRGDFGVLGF